MIMSNNNVDVVNSNNELLTALDALNSSNIENTEPTGLKYQSFSNLLPGEYSVYNFSNIETKYGRRVRVCLETSYVILPERFTKTLTKENIIILNNNPIIMCYSGKDPNNRNRLIIHFRNVYYSVI